MEGIWSTDLLHFFWKALCMKDETLVHCLTAIIILVPLETSFCSVSICFELKGRIIFTCLVLKWCSETRYEMDKTDKQWRQPLKSWSPLSCLLLASGQQPMWITYFFVWFNRSALHSEGTQEILLVFTRNIHFIWEVTLPGCNLFMISKKTVCLVSFQQKFKN